MPKSDSASPISNMFDGVRSVYDLHIEMMTRVLPALQWCQARNQNFMLGGANEAKVDQTTETYFLLSDPFI